MKLGSSGSMFFAMVNLPVLLYSLIFFSSTCSSFPSPVTSSLVKNYCVLFFSESMSLSAWEWLPNLIDGPISRAFYLGRMVHARCSGTAGLESMKL